MGGAMVVRVHRLLCAMLIGVGLLGLTLGTVAAQPGAIVVEADATDLPFEPGTFSAAICMTMLHHVPEAAQQDRLIAEMARVVRPGGVVLGTDNLDSPQFREGHVDDICNPIDPATLAARLAAVGLANVEIETNPYAFKFRVRV